MCRRRTTCRLELKNELERTIDETIMKKKKSLQSKYTNHNISIHQRLITEYNANSERKSSF